MNRRQKIIVSITGIFIVLLALVGLTYAYFLTRIRGNNADKSISVTTANLSLVYSDNSSEILGKNKGPIYPDSENPIGTKTFTVTNDGTETVNNYAVTIEDFSIVYANDFKDENDKTITKGTPTTLNSPTDMKLVITCTSSVEGKTCEGFDVSLPEENTSIIENISIDAKEVHTYRMTLTYLETGEDQSKDMNKTIEGKINIMDMNNTVDLKGTVASYQPGDYVQVNSEPKISQIKSDGTYKIVGLVPETHKIQVYDKSGKAKGTAQNFTINKGTTQGVSGTTITIEDETRLATININSNYSINISSTLIKSETSASGTLADNIINNAKSSKNGTTYIENLSATGMVYNVTTANDKILSTAEDDDGESYYFRGNPIDNYVEFGNMCWRIVRIDGDGNIKLILASELTCSEANLTDDSGYATNGGRGVKGTILQAHYGYEVNYEYYSNGAFIADYINSPYNNSNSARTRLNSWLDKKLTEVEQGKLKEETWCIGDLINAYDRYDDEIVGTVSEMLAIIEDFEYIAGNRFSKDQTPSYKCEISGNVEGETDTNKVGMLTMDEIVYAGGGAKSISKSNSNYYLNNNAKTKLWWSLSPDGFSTINRGDRAFYVHSTGYLRGYSVSSGYGFGDVYHGLRPSVTLMSGTTITSGDGLVGSPYKISLD